MSVNVSLTTDQVAVIDEAVRRYEEYLHSVRVFNTLEVDPVMRECFGVRSKLLPFMPKSSEDGG